MTLVLVVIAVELAALLYLAWRTHQLLEKKIWNNTATIDGNMMDAKPAPQQSLPSHLERALGIDVGAETKKETMLNAVTAAVKSIDRLFVLMAVSSTDTIAGSPLIRLFLVNNTATSYASGKVLTAGAYSVDDQLRQTSQDTATIKTLDARTAIEFGSADVDELELGIWYQIDLFTHDGNTHKYFLTLPKVFSWASLENVEVAGATTALVIPLLPRHGESIDDYIAQKSDAANKHR